MVLTVYIVEQGPTQAEDKRLREIDTTALPQIGERLCLESQQYRVVDIFYRSRGNRMTLAMVYVKPLKKEEIPENSEDDGNPWAEEIPVLKAASEDICELEGPYECVCEAISCWIRHSLNRCRKSSTALTAVGSSGCQQHRFLKRRKRYSPSLHTCGRCPQLAFKRSF